VRNERGFGGQPIRIVQDEKLREVLEELLARLARARDLVEVNVAAGIAANELAGIDEEL
jgi:hypothetical protein